MKYLESALHAHEPVIYVWSEKKIEFDSVGHSSVAKVSSGCQDLPLERCLRGLASGAPVGGIKIQLSLNNKRKMEIACRAAQLGQLGQLHIVIATGQLQLQVAGRCKQCNICTLRY